MDCTGWRFGLGRRLVVERSIGGAILARLNEAEDLAVIFPHRAPDLDQGRDILGGDFCLIMGGGTGLADGNIGGIAQYQNIFTIFTFHMQAVAIGRDPTVFTETVLLDNFLTLVRRDCHQQIVISRYHLPR